MTATTTSHSVWNETIIEDPKLCHCWSLRPLMWIFSLKSRFNPACLNTTNVCTQHALRHSFLNWAPTWSESEWPRKKVISLILSPKVSGRLSYIKHSNPRVSSDIILNVETGEFWNPHQYWLPHTGRGKGQATAGWLIPSTGREIQTVTGLTGGKSSGSGGIHSFSKSSQHTPTTLCP